MIRPSLGLLRRNRCTGPKQAEKQPPMAASALQTGQDMNKELLETSAWLQVNVRLRKEDSAGAAQMLFHSLAPLIEELLPFKSGGRFHFMRKPPAIRLRFLPVARRAELEERLKILLDALKSQQIVSSWYFTCYEPEMRRFGGPATLELVHEHLHADAMCWWAWERARARGDTSLTASALSELMLADLFDRVLDSSMEEIWDVWCSIAEMHGVPRPDAPCSRPPADYRLSLADRAVLNDYHEANRRFAVKLKRLAQRGKVRLAHRGLLAPLAIAHWNLWGFVALERQQILRPIVRAPGLDVAA